eukprot:486826-Hanusia_phi.AAC.3
MSRGPHPCGTDVTCQPGYHARGPLMPDSEYSELSPAPSGSAAAEAERRRVTVTVTTTEPFNG